MFMRKSYPGDKQGERKELVVKLLSQDPSNYRDAPTEGIRRVLEKVLGKSLPRGEKLNTDKIGKSSFASDFIRLSTTVATNALLERKGQKHALVITKGFKDLLTIGNQSRPRIFDLNIRRPTPLFTDVLEVDERVTIVGYTSDPKAAEHAIKTTMADGPGEIVRGLSGEAVRIIKKPDENKIKSDLQKLREQGYTSLAICLLLGIQSHFHLLSTHADDQDVLGRIFSGFDEQLKAEESENRESNLWRVTADFWTWTIFRSQEYTQWTCWWRCRLCADKLGRERANPIIGLDVGGTSTDVSRFDGRYETVYETTTAGVTIQSPQLDINTVAAGGGSCLTFRMAYSSQDPKVLEQNPGLHATGRLIPDLFPKIFGKSENEPLDMEASKSAFEKVAKEVRSSADKDYTLDEVIYGFIKVANETMCRPIRAITEARGYSTGSHILASFGGAGGQHACDIARLLGIHRILIHRHSSILSAYGLALADRAYERQEPSSENWSEESKPRLLARLDALTEEVKSSLEKQGFKGDRVRVERLLNMRFDGTDTSLMVLEPEDGSHDFEGTFKRAYKQEFGFLLETKNIIIDDIKVRGIGKTFDTLGPSVFEEMKTLKTKPVNVQATQDRTHSVYFEGPGRIDTPVFLLEKLEVGDVVSGPAMIIDNTQTIVLNPHSKTTVTRNHLFISLEDE
ncbi:5-oxoprolinase [Rhizoctonia solani]|uniref:5-oxoprolinase n=1 Tax=Rhizoctonia solani TaxID=456999 RepID=A0A8H8NZ58_9AGAM|nr:5-oxoprolinase [Rhizoctonia solani]QRW22771.1 5-oxoprolinase [Rhizoctonia solani]